MSEMFNPMRLSSFEHLHLHEHLLLLANGKKCKSLLLFE